MSDCGDRGARISLNVSIASMEWTMEWRGFGLAERLRPCILLLHFTSGITNQDLGNDVRGISSLKLLVLCCRYNRPQAPVKSPFWVLASFCYET